MAFLNQLMLEMESNQIFILGEINPVSQSYQRFKSASCSSKGKSIFVKVIGNMYGAIYGDWRQGGYHLWFAEDWKKLSRQEKERRKLEFKLAKRQLQCIQNEVIGNCKIIFNLSEKLRNSHPYIRKKQIIPYYARQYAEMVVVPVYSLLGQIQTLQYIYPDGYKRFHGGAPMTGGFLILGEHLVNPISICEGWSTACTIREIINQPVITTFSCHNMKKVALDLKKKCPSLQLIVCADNDYQSEKNYGLDAAREIQTATGAQIYYPVFSQSLAIKDKRASDFNDLMRIAGINEARKQLIGLIQEN